MSKVRKLFEDTPPPPIAVKEIKLGKRVEITYVRNYGNGAFSEHVEKCQPIEEILPEFEDALDGLTADLCHEEGLDPTLWQNCMITKISWKTPNVGSASSFKVTLQTHRDYSDRTRTHSTPQTSPATLSPEFRDAMDQVVVEAIRFINGERSNQQLELNLPEAV